MKTFSRRCANWLSGGSSRTESTLASQGLSWFSLHPPSHPSGGLRKALLKMQSIPPISVHIPGTNPLSQDRWREMEAGLPDAGLREGFAALCFIGTWNPSICFKSTNENSQWGGTGRRLGEARSRLKASELRGPQRLERFGEMTPPVAFLMNTSLTVETRRRGKVRQPR